MGSPVHCAAHTPTTHQVRINPPNEAAREAIFRVHTRRLALDLGPQGGHSGIGGGGATAAEDAELPPPALTDVAAQTRAGLAALAARTVGYTGADIAALCREAAFAAMDRALDAATAAGGSAGAAVRRVGVTMADFEGAMELVGASALRSVAPAPPTTTWADVGGLGDVKQRLKQVSAACVLGWSDVQGGGGGTLKARLTCLLARWLWRWVRGTGC